METSPQVYARIGGVLYLVIIALGLFAEGFVSNELIVSGDATATAHVDMHRNECHRLLLRNDIGVPGDCSALPQSGH
jgi:hypothetical protein